VCPFKGPLAGVVIAKKNPLDQTLFKAALSRPPGAVAYQEIGIQR